MKLTPIEYRLPEPFAYVSACYCSGFAPKYIAKEQHRPPYWWVDGTGRKRYWRQEEGWCDSTPTQFPTARAAASAFWKWAQNPKNHIALIGGLTPEEIGRFNNLTPEKIRELRTKMGLAV
jgi:hypothetical protein